MKSGKIIVIVSIIGVIAVFAGIIGFAGGGGVRHVNIFLPEQIKQTVAFQNIDGEVKLVGLTGVDGEPNPDLVMRAGDYEYVLTVINQDNSPHQLYIEGLEVKTKLLQPGEKDTVSAFSKKDTTYNYYDISGEKKLLGKLRSTFVVPKDKLYG